MAASELWSQSDSNVNLPWTSISSRGSRPVTKLLAASCYRNYNEAVRAIRELGLRGLTFFPHVFDRNLFREFLFALLHIVYQMRH